MCVSDASFSMIAAGRGLEHLLMLVHELPEKLSDRETAILLYTSDQLKSFRAFLQRDTVKLPLPVFSDFPETVKQTVCSAAPCSIHRTDSCT